MTNPLVEFNDFIRANLPSGMTFDTDRVRYVVNEKPFPTYVQAFWYLTYINKFGFEAAAADFEDFFTANFGAPTPEQITSGNAILTSLLDASADVRGVPYDLGSLAAQSGIFLTQALENSYNNSDWQDNPGLFGRVTERRAAAENAFKPNVYEDNDFFATNFLDKIGTDSNATECHAHVLAWHRVSSIPLDWDTALNGTSIPAVETEVKDYLTNVKADADAEGIVVHSYDVINEFGLQSTNGGVEGWRYDDNTQDDKGSLWIDFANKNYPQPTRTERIYAFIGDLVTWTKEVFPGVKAVFTDFDALHPDHPLNPTTVEGTGGNYVVNGESVFSGFGDLQTKQHRHQATARLASTLGFDAVGMQAHLFANRAFSFDGIRRRVSTYKSYGLEVYLIEANVKVDSNVSFDPFTQGSDEEGYFCANHFANFLHACGPHLDGIIMWTDATDSGNNTGWTLFGSTPGSNNTHRITPIWFALAWYLEARANGLYDVTSDEGETIELNRALPYEMVSVGSPSINADGTRNANDGSLTGSYADLFPSRNPATETTSITWNHVATSTGTLFVQGGGTFPIQILLNGTNNVDLEYNGTSVSLGTAGGGSRNRVAICQVGGQIQASLNGGTVQSITATETPTDMWIGGPEGGIEDWTVSRPRVEMVRMFAHSDASRSQLEPATFCYNPEAALPDSRTQTADTVITSDAEWDAFFGQATSVIDGQIVEIDGTFTSRSISNHTFIDGLKIRSASASDTLPRLALTNVSNLHCRGLNFQMTGWPKDHNSLIRLESGTYNNLSFKDCTFRHGYGSSLVDFDTAADLPEYNRVDNVQTATTSSATYALTYQDSAATSARIYVFNRDATNSAFVAVGGSGVTATTGDTEVAPNSRVLLEVNPTTDTHVALITGAGTAEVNARTEVGMAYYLADMYEASGAADVTNMTFDGCTVTDVFDAFKFGSDVAGDFVAIDNTLLRIYQDLFGMRPDYSGAGTVYILRNQGQLPFSRQGIPEDDDGDARDPHGDFIQGFGDGSGTIKSIYSAGNRFWPGSRRVGVSGQGIFLRDNDTSPSYEDIVSVSDVIVVGSPNTLAIGESATFPAKGGIIYGATAVDASDSNALSNLEAYMTEDGPLIVRNSIVSGNGTGALVTDSTIAAGAGVSGLFSDYASLATANNLTELEAALTTTNGQGAYATEAAFLPRTKNYEAVIRWNVVPSGVGWSELLDQPVNTQVSTPLTKVVNPKRGQAVAPGAGVEWRSTQADKTTEIQAWTSTSGMINGGEYIQIRFTTNAAATTTDTFTISINGFTESVDATTALALTDPFVLGTTYFVDPSNVPSNTRRIEFEARMDFKSDTVGFQTLFSQVAAIRFTVDSDEQDARITLLEDSSTNNKITTGSNIPLGITIGTPFTAYFDVDFNTEQVRILVNDSEVTTIPFTSSSTGVAQDNRAIVFAGYTSAELPTDTEVEYFKVWFTNTAGTRSLHKEISVASQGSVANINSDAWTNGTVT